MANTKLSREDKKLLNRCFIGTLACLRTISSTVGQGRSMVITLAPIINKFYKTEEEKKEAIFRHASEFHNTHQVMFGLIAGITCAMERERAEKGTIDAGLISGLKASLMGPLAGVGDSFFFNAFRVIIAGVCIGIAADGNLLGPILFLILYGGGLLAIKYYLFIEGYRNGMELVDRATNEGIIPLFMESSSVLGSIMVGALIATLVRITIVFQPTIGGAMLDVQSIFDNVMPGILSVVLWWVTYKAMKNGMTPIKMIFSIMGVSIVLAFFGIL